MSLPLEIHQETPQSCPEHPDFLSWLLEATIPGAAICVSHFPVFLLQLLGPLGPLPSQAFPWFDVEMALNIPSYNYGP